MRKLLALLFCGLFLFTGCTTSARYSGDPSNLPIEDYEEVGEGVWVIANRLIEEMPSGNFPADFRVTGRFTTTCLAFGDGFVNFWGLTDDEGHTVHQSYGAEEIENINGVSPESFLESVPLYHCGELDLLELRDGQDVTVKLKSEVVLQAPAVYSALIGQPCEEAVETGIYLGSEGFFKVD